MDAARMDMLKQPLAAYLAHRFGPKTELLEVVKFPRGSSRETWFVAYRPGPQAALVRVVFRTDFPSGSTIPSSLDQEYFMYERLGHTDVPVARVLWWEADPYWASRPFYVREHIEGSWSIPHYHDPNPAYDALRIEVSREHIRNLARVHRVDWKALGLDKHLPVPASAEEAGRFYIEQVQAQFRGLRGEPIPLFTMGAHWLKLRAPAAPCVSLCKGTNGMGEEVFHDGKIVAMSDWEEAAIGDPAADFAFAQELVSDIERDGRKLWTLAQCLDYYFELCGIRISLESVGFYRMVQSLKMVMYSESAAVGVHATPDAHIRQAWTGTEVAYVGKKILASAMGLSPPLPASRFAELNKSMG
jgi:aminoglycoside phosphotransferase (APT) family kinase protein